MSRSIHPKYRSQNRPRRHGLKLPGGYRCKCCYSPEEGKAKERRLCRREVQSQLAEVPDDQHVFSDFRELPDFLSSWGDWGEAWANCYCDSCNPPMYDEEEAA